MSRPATRPKNATQRPGLILLEGTQKRRTSEQKQADDEHAEQERLAQEAARERGIKRIANLMDQSAQREEHVRTHPPQPRPRPRIFHKASSMVGQASREAEDDQTQATQRGLETQQLEEGRSTDEDEPLEGSQIPDEMLCKFGQYTTTETLSHLRARCQPDTRRW